MLKASNLLAALAVSLILFPGCTTLTATRNQTILPPGTLSAAEIESLFRDKTVESETVSGRISLTYYNPDGNLQQLRYGKIRSGKWWIRKDARICLQIDGGDQQCRIIVKENGVYKKYVVKKNNHHRHVITYHSFRPGNLVSK